MMSCLWEIASGRVSTLEGMHLFFVFWEKLWSEHGAGIPAHELAWLKTAIGERMLSSFYVYDCLFTAHGSP